MVGWEEAAVTLEVEYTAMCSISPIIKKRSRGVISYRNDVGYCAISINNGIIIIP